MICRNKYGYNILIWFRFRNKLFFQKHQVNWCQQFVLAIRTICCSGGGQLCQHSSNATNRNSVRRRFGGRKRQQSVSIQICRRQRYQPGYRVTYNNVCTWHAHSTCDNGASWKTEVHESHQATAWTHTDLGSWMLVRNRQYTFYLKWLVFFLV